MVPSWAASSHDPSLGHPDTMQAAPPGGKQHAKGRGGARSPRGLGKGEVSKKPGNNMKLPVRSAAIHPKKGHHRGIGRAIELPSRALFNTFVLILIPFY